MPTHDSSSRETARRCAYRQERWPASIKVQTAMHACMLLVLAWLHMRVCTCMVILRSKQDTQAGETASMQTRSLAITALKIKRHLYLDNIC